ncbi:MAG TPA: hypothetical protein VL995_08345 [Cellvibrio sp.]|nr:hypothetical protein [Cellvibrio sp.]
MSYKTIVFSFFLVFINGCVIAEDNSDKQGGTVAEKRDSVDADKREAVSSDSRRLPVSYALQGTSTAVVGIAIDKKGYPLETVKAIILKPGQKVVFAGPDEFQIAFKNKKAPTMQLDYRSEKGVITVVIPKDILERPEFKREYARNKSVEFNYAIRINGRELDPPMIIQRDD